MYMYMHIFWRGDTLRVDTKNIANQDVGLNNYMFYIIVDFFSEKFISLLTLMKFYIAYFFFFYMTNSHFLMRNYELY